ncbi:MAG: T9SS type A sorting domain-containing protein [Chitinispirillales bacterium]|jgi:hypothetical protein|nr:T9SS type A sorting domain-containing protein [Chitinispirillales bacterium]
MGRFTKRLIAGLVAALAVTVGGAFADSTLDDFESGSNANKFGAYWYFYTNTFAAAAENNPTGCDQKAYTSALVSDKLEKIDNATKSGSQLLFAGSYGSTLTAAHDGQYSGVMKYSNLQSPWKSVTTLSAPDVYPGVGMGTGLTTDTINGMGAEFNSAKKVKFWLKTSSTELVVKFKIEFVTQIAGNPGHGAWSGDLAGCNADASYEIILDAPSTAWKQYEINIEPSNTGSGQACVAPKLCKPTWESGKEYTYDLSKASKIAWFIEGAGAPPEVGWIAVDDIEITGYTFVDKWLCESCVKPDNHPVPDASLLFSDFDNLLPGNQTLAQNKEHQYWYAYGDSAARGGQGTVTTIDMGQWNDPYYTLGPSLQIDDPETPNTYGFGGTRGAFISFTMGTPFTKNGESVQPFVGIGTNLAETDSLEVYDGSQLASIWFRYKTTGFEELFVEFHDEYAISPAHDDGEVFYTKLPGTDGGWKIAEIPLSVLRLPPWAKNRTGPLATLDKTKLAKIQFKNQSTNDGTIIIDDVYLLDPAHAVSVKLLGSKSVKASGIRAVYSRGKIGVNWNAGTSVASGKIQLVNTKGRVVASAPIANTAGKVTASLGTGTIPTGMYFVRVNAKDVNGKKIVSQAPVSVVK